MHISRSFLAATAAALLLSPPAMAQEVSLDTVVATVNGDAITMAHVLDIKRQLPDEYQNIPDTTLFQGIIDQLIQQTVMAQATPTPPSWIDVALQNQRRIILSSQHIAQLQSQAVTEDALKAAYDATYANAPASQEYHAAHILVETREEAAEAGGRGPWRRGFCRTRKGAFHRAVWPAWGRSGLVWAWADGPAV